MSREGGMTINHPFEDEPASEAKTEQALPLRVLSGRTIGFVELLQKAVRPSLSEVHRRYLTIISGAARRIAWSIYSLPRVQSDRSMLRMVRRIVHEHEGLACAEGRVGAGKEVNREIRDPDPTPRG